MQLKMRQVLGKYLILLIFSIVVLSCSRTYKDSRRLNLRECFILDTVYFDDHRDKDAVYGIGLKNAVTKEKQGLWHFFQNNELIKMVSYKDGEKYGPLVGFNSFEGVSSITTFSFLIDGEFEGPSIRMRGDSIINYYHYYNKGNVVKSIFIGGNGDIEYSVNDSTSIIGKIPQD